MASGAIQPSNASRFAAKYPTRPPPGTPLVSAFILFINLLVFALYLFEVPWHVEIYQNGEQICGGTIVSDRMVITAAQCFFVTSLTNYSHNIDLNAFKVAAGKYKRGLDAEEKLETQIRDVAEVEISERADIASVIIVGYFEYRPHIMPACLKFTKDPAEKYPKLLTLTMVAGWGTTKVGPLRFPLNISLWNFSLLVEFSVQRDSTAVSRCSDRFDSLSGPGAFQGHSDWGQGLKSTFAKFLSDPFFL